jgi:hypothetical protein
MRRQQERRNARAIDKRTRNAATRARLKAAGRPLTTSFCNFTTVVVAASPNLTVTSSICPLCAANFRAAPFALQPGFPCVDRLRCKIARLRAKGA